jgi:hypothetical protein
LQPLNGFIALHKVISSLPCRGVLDIVYGTNGCFTRIDKF